MTAEPRSGLRELLSLAVPIAGTILADVAMPISDGIICGHIDDHGRSFEALALGLQLWFLLCVPLWALATATVALASRAHGANDHERLNRVAAVSTQLAIVVGTVIGGICAVFGQQIFAVFGASPEVAEKGATYLRVMALAFPAIYVAEACLSSLLRAAGNTRLPFVCGVATNVLNVVLAYGLVLGHFGLPALGIAGAGIATAISIVANLVLVAIGSRRAIVVRPFTPFDRELAASLVRIAVPTALDQLVFAGTMTAFYWIIGHIDEPALAAHAIGARTATFLLVPTFALRQATGALVGNALGAEDPEKARATLRLSLATVAAVMVPIAVLAYLCAPWILGAYDVEPRSAIEAYALRWMHVIAFAMVLDGLYSSFQGLFYGAGASKTVMRINVSVNVGLRLAMAIVLGLYTDLGALGVWLSWPAALLVQLPLAVIVYRRGNWANTGVEVDG